MSPQGSWLLRVRAPRCRTEPAWPQVRRQRVGNLRNPPGVRTSLPLRLEWSRVLPSSMLLWSLKSVVYSLGGLPHKQQFPASELRAQLAT